MSDCLPNVVVHGRWRKIFRVLCFCVENVEHFASLDAFQPLILVLTRLFPWPEEESGHFIKYITLNLFYKGQSDFLLVVSPKFLNKLSKYVPYLSLIIDKVCLTIKTIIESFFQIH